MKIAATDLQMSSSHLRLQHQEEQESLKMWVGSQRPDFEGKGKTAPRPPAAEPVQLSDQGKAAQAQESQGSGTDDASLDPKLSLLKTVIEYL